MTRLDYREVLRECGPDDVVFCDPPYIVRAYDDRMLDHLEMVGLLKAANFRWMLTEGMLTEYARTLYLGAFGEPNFRIEVQKVMHNSNSSGGKRLKAVEYIWKKF